MPATSPTAPTSGPQASLEASDPLTRALVGQWTGLLIYRDYSEPASSTKRVQLPTWLTISRQPEGLRLKFVYDDGPNKTVTSESTLVLDTHAATYSVLGTDGTVERYSIGGLQQLKDGRGTLLLSGPGTDNSKPAEVRTTWTIGRNILSWLEEVKPSGSGEAFVFRHQYTLVRSQPPSASAISK